MEVSGKKAGNEDNLSSLDKLCEPCEVDNVNTQASGLCKECEEYMCNACFRQHLKAKSCRNHTLIDTDAFSETCLRSNASAIKCKQHEADTVKYYCRTHEAVGCGECIVSKHGGCKPEFIKDLSDNFQQNEEYKTCMNTLENLISKRKEFEKKVQENKKDNKVMLEKALQDMKQFRLDINKYLDKVETDITCQVKNVMEENDILLSKLENDCTILSAKLEEIKNMLNSEVYKDNALFIHVVECKQKLPESEKAISDMKSKSMKTYEFLCDQQLDSFVNSSHKLGTLSISTLAVFPQTTVRANERSISQEYPKGNDNIEHHYDTISKEGREEGEKQQQQPEEKPTKIVVTDLPSSAHEESLEMFFENTRKFGGGPVFNVEYDEDSSSAVVEFEEPEAVDIVLNKRPIKMLGSVVEVDIYRPEEPFPRRTIEVTGPCNIICIDHAESLAMYFMNKRRSGGGEIVECRSDFENKMILVTFESEEVAQRVVERASHIFMRERLQVKLHMPYKKSKKKDEAKNEEIEKPVPEPIKTVKVKGVDNDLSEDTLEFYFESRRRSGGGEIEIIERDEEEEDVLYVTFTNAEDAENVSKRTTHRLEGRTFQVSLHEPHKPPLCFENKILNKGLKPLTTKDCLFNFTEAYTEFVPENLDYHAEQDFVMLTFEKEKVVRSLVAVGARVRHNNPFAAFLRGYGFVTAVYEDGTVKVKWDKGGTQLERVGAGSDEVTLI